jgi:hypothetical protein
MIMEVVLLYVNESNISCHKEETLSLGNITIIASNVAAVFTFLSKSEGGGEENRSVININLYIALSRERETTIYGSIHIYFMSSTPSLMTIIQEETLMYSERQSKSIFCVLKDDERERGGEVKGKKAR